jgi:hypothetical protein
VYHGFLFDMCQSKVSEWIKFLLPVLESCLSKLNFMPLTGSEFKPATKIDTDYLIADVSEHAIPRRRCDQAQQVEYSGKKKCHTIKNLAITDSNGAVLYLSETYEGSVHDETIFDQVQIHKQGLNLLLDLGFQGDEKDCQNAILPFKKPKNKELTDLQKSINKGISKERVLIENVFASIKRLKIIRNKVRLTSSNARHLIMMLASGLHNIRNTFRRPLINHS